ncbi:MAG: hypothetical protein IKN42_03825 [Elusimicrobia bacterium]|nr:hypothetical protein [Elusimicrobiota bacterium]
MCIGESTTQNQYPVYLGQYLKQYIPEKNFVIIDSGYAGINLDNIAKNLKVNIDNIKPNIVVGMIGINDTIDYSFKAYSKIKTIYLIQLIIEHFKLKNVKIDKDNNVLDKREIITNLEDLELRDKTQQQISDFILSKSSEQDLSKVFVEEKEGILLNPYAQNNELSVKIIDKYYSDDKKPVTFDELLNTIYEDTTIKPEFRYGIKGITCMLNGQFDSGEKYLDMADSERLKYDYSEISKKYEKILDSVIPEGIIYIAMQYPVRDIGSLQKIIEKTKYADSVFYISNKNVFRTALKEDNRKDIFRDLFAWDFGHCTKYGNMLIANNLAQVIKIILDEQKN